MENVQTVLPSGTRRQPSPGISTSCVNLRTLGYGITGVQRYLLSLLPNMPRELGSVKPSRALQGIKGHVWEQFYFLPS